MNNRWAEQFTWFEALLSRGNIFSTPNTSIKPVTSHLVLSFTPFIALAAQSTSPVETLACQEVRPKHAESKEKKKLHKSKGEKHSKHEKSSTKPVQAKPLVSAQDTIGPGDVQ